MTPPEPRCPLQDVKRIGGVGGCRALCTAACGCEADCGDDEKGNFGFSSSESNTLFLFIKFRTECKEQKRE